MTTSTPPDLLKVVTNAMLILAIGGILIGLLTEGQVAMIAVIILLIIIAAYFMVMAFKK